MSNQEILTGLVLDLVNLSKDLTSLAEKINNVKISDDERETTNKEKFLVRDNTSSPVTIEQVRAVMAEKSQAGLTAQVRTLLEKYGANKLSAVNPENYADLLEAALQLG